MFTTQYGPAARNSDTRTALMTALVCGLVGTWTLLIGSSSARAADFTVGAGGTHSRIQAAFDAVLATSGPHTVRIAEGTYFENLKLDGFSSGSVTITGGWSADFESRNLDPTRTVIDGSLDGRVLYLACRAGTVRLRGLTLTGGAEVGSPVPGDPDIFAGTGGGGFIRASGSCFVHFTESIVKGNLVRNEGAGAWQAAAGGGITLITQDDAQVFFGDLVVEENEVATRATTPGDTAYGGGVAISMFDSSNVHVTQSAIRKNKTTGYQAIGGGIAVDAYDQTLLRFDDSLVTDNRLTAPSSTIGSGISAGGGHFGAGESYRLVLERLRVWDNVASWNNEQVFLRQGGDGFTWLRFGDSIVVGNVYADRDYEGTQTMHLTNLTVDGRIRAYLPGLNRATVSLYNSIATQGVLADKHMVLGSNHVGSDPGFIDPSLRDYRLATGSPAIDAGDGLAPGGLGFRDVDFLSRVQGTVDIGAHERQDEGQTCRIFPAGPSTPACVCLSDDTLRALRCGFTLPDLFVNVRIPFDVALPSYWHLQTWNGQKTTAKLWTSVVTTSGEKPIASWKLDLSPGTTTTRKAQVSQLPDGVLKSEILISTPHGFEEWTLEMPAHGLVKTRNE